MQPPKYPRRRLPEWWEPWLYIIPGLAFLALSYSAIDAPSFTGSVIAGIAGGGMVGLGLSRYIIRRYERGGFQFLARFDPRRKHDGDEP